MEGNIKQLFTKVQGILKKNGPFEVLTMYIMLHVHMHVHVAANTVYDCKVHYATCVIVVEMYAVVN